MIVLVVACSDPPVDGTRVDTTDSGESSQDAGGDVSGMTSDASSGDVDLADTPDPGHPDAPDTTDSTMDVATDAGGDLGPDAGPVPEGCCGPGAPCGADQVCAGSPIGICSTAPEEGWCWQDSDCANHEVCHGAEVCPCGVECKTHHPGVCAPASGCAPLKSEWVEEICDAASLVIFDGTNCVPTCLGCCGCGPFCDKTFNSVEQCESQCLGTDACPAFITARAECPYNLSLDGTCPHPYCRNSPCTQDSECPTAGVAPGPSWCVLGNCSACWNDAQCQGGTCRGGRCVAEAEECPNTGACTAPGCSVVTVSESPCPVCVCDTIFDKPCENDLACQSISSVPYARCVFGRCAQCRSDTDCDEGSHCAPPGVCAKTTPNPSDLFGLWVIGWFGGLDHFSYLRFEPDGTLRRGVYEMNSSFVNDFPALPCSPDESWPVNTPLLGTWEVIPNEAGDLLVQMNLNLSCDAAAGWTDRYIITFEPNPGPMTIYLDDPDGDQSVNGWRAQPDACTPDLADCLSPTWPPT